MHRTKTRFAARINRVATALERRGVVATYKLHDRMLANRDARRRFGQEAPTLDETQQRIVDRLSDEGYAVVPFSELYPDPAVWGGIDSAAEAFISETERALASEHEGAESTLRRRAGKEFVIRKYAYGVQLGLDDPWLALGVNRRLLDVAN